MASTPNTRGRNTPKNLVISVGSYDGFRLKDGRLCLGWLSFGSAPRDLESRLERAVQEIDALKAELDRVTNEHQQELATVREANATLERQVARVSAEAEQKLQSALQGKEELQAQWSRLSSENERLKALIERVSSGVR